MISSKQFLFHNIIEEVRRIELAHEILRLDHKNYEKDKSNQNMLINLQKKLKKIY